VQLCSFQDETESFLKWMFHAACIEKLEPSVWWTSIKKTCKNVNAELYDLAITLLHLPSSSASIEGIFSNFGVIQTKLRNRLGTQKAAKVVTCYRKLRGEIDLDWWLCCEILNNKQVHVYIPYTCILYMQYHHHSINDSHHFLFYFCIAFTLKTTPYVNPV